MRRTGKSVLSDAEGYEDHLKSSFAQDVGRDVAITSRAQQGWKRKKIPLLIHSDLFSGNIFYSNFSLRPLTHEALNLRD